ncbi:MAG TPA: hypothetical protein DIW64_13355 [Cellvibrio sp.]|nr:hypothetical protein [Cellvibrio sp.]
MLIVFGDHNAVGSPCDSDGWLKRDKKMIILATKTGARGLGIIVRFSDNNNQTIVRIPESELAHKFL